jgi:hypothetical protein
VKNYPIWTSRGREGPREGLFEKIRPKWIFCRIRTPLGRLVDGVDVLSETWEINVTAIKLCAIVGGIAFSASVSSAS